MEFSRRLTRAPIPFDAEAGADPAALVPGVEPGLHPLLSGAAGCSPFLRDLMAREAGWAAEALCAAPETALDAELARLGTVEPAQLGAELRRAKRRVALLVALADLGGVWALPEVTGALTRLADRAVDTGLRALVAAEIRRGKLPGATEQDAATGAGMVALAMGKMGAGELNYSSDIDLICLFDETRFDEADRMEARAAFIRVTRRLCSLLSDLTAEGYVFRTDLRLRPDASVTPVCISMEAAERYYESFGRTWERAAFIKARPCAGDIAAGARFLAALTPFVWRRHLDFAAIQDAHDMRLRIRAHKGLHAGAGENGAGLEGYNLKLAPGGIREIEFFTQTRQLIAGGRDAGLRDATTVGGLAALAGRGWIPQDVAAELSEHYAAHREVEHRLQMIGDAQTQILPANPEGFDRLARFSGFGDTAAWRAELAGRLVRVADLTEGFYVGSAAGAEGPPPELSPQAEAIVTRWQSYPALRSDRALALFSRLRPEILRRLQRAADAEGALAQFDAFLSRLPAGVQLFSLFEANPQLIDLIVDICATAPRLAQYLGRNAGVLDAVIGGDFFSPWPGQPALAAMLAARLREEADYERKLDAARVWAREWHFRIGVHHLRGLTDAFEAAAQYADLARAVIGALWHPVLAEFAARHGAPPGRGAVVLGMGSLGAGRLNAVSDLDLILIYDADGQEESAGPRPLSATQYYARLTKALITALSAPMAEGRLYEVDMRLRPSGRKGPVATALSAFRSYQMTEAWTWEHLALTRARPVAGGEGRAAGGEGPTLAEEIEAVRRAVLAAKGKEAEKVRAGAGAMRARLAAARPGAGLWDVKAGPGRLHEIELVAQTAALLAGSAQRGVENQLAAGRRAGWPDAATAELLRRAYQLCWRVHCAGRLLADGVIAPEALGSGACSFIEREAGIEGIDALGARIAGLADAAARAIDGLLPPPGEGSDSNAAGLRPTG